MRMFRDVCFSLLIAHALCSNCLVIFAFEKVEGTGVGGSTLESRGAELPGEAPCAEPSKLTAVTMNYCRASFHRIRKTPSKRVLLEEQAKILNNLNLRGIDDQEVISLYSAVLDEVGRETIAEKEKIVIQDGYRYNLRQQALSKAFILGAEVGTAQYVSAVRTGANSWWDYRNLTTSRDVDTWKVDKSRMTEVVDKSSRFMDTFWKLAQKKQIPDEWLVRGDDLDRLEAAAEEQDPQVRLRVLQRMERFMTCYPPYWYHLGRTQQALGKLAEAAQTYEHLRTLGHGHFRKDDMLSAALANRAVILSSLREPGALQSARQALEYSNTCWQANLVCAQVLAQHHEYAEAEDATLRNLDVALEQQQSLASLLSLYCETDDHAKLTARLKNPETVSLVATPVLLRCAAELGTEKLPPPAMHQIVCSLYGFEQTGRQQLSFVVQPNWELDNAAASLSQGGIDFTSPRKTETAQGQTLLQFAAQDQRLSLGDQEELLLDLRYTDSKPLRLHLERRAWTPEMQSHFEQLARRDQERSSQPEPTPFEIRSPRDLFRILPTSQTQTVARPPRFSYVITKVDLGDEHLALLDASSQVKDASPGSLESLESADSPAEDSASETAPESPAERRRPVAPTPRGVTLLKIPLETLAPKADN